MVALLERLRKEWHVVRGAPFSVAIVCLAAISAGWGGIRWYYADKIKEADARADRWKGDVDYWKDQVNRKQSCPPVVQVDPSKTVPTLQKSTTANQRKNGAAGTSTNIIGGRGGDAINGGAGGNGGDVTLKGSDGAPASPISQSCESGSNCAASVGQQGGITAGQVMLGQKTWDMVMSGDRQQAMIRTLQQSVPGSIRVEWLAFDPDSLKVSGGILYTFTNAGWKENKRANAAGSMCYPSQEWDCRGFSVTVRDKNSNSAKAALQALSILGEPIRVTESDKTQPDDLVIIFAAKP